MALKKSALLPFALLVLALCLGVYSLGLNNELVFDDARLSDGGLFAQYGSLWPIKARLLSYGSFVWIHQLVGESYPIQRVINLAWHMATSLIIYLLMRKLLGRIEEADGPATGTTISASQNAALAVGMVFFVLAPVAVYAVGYLIQRTIVMATFFSAMACWCFVCGLTARSSRHKAVWLAAAVLSYVLAVLSKEQSFLIVGLALPIYIFIVRPSWKKSLGLAALVVALLAVAFTVLLKVYPNLLGQLFDDTSRQLAAQLDRQRPGAGQQIYLLSVLNQAGLFFYYGLLWVVPVVGWMSIDMRPAFPLTLLAMPQLFGAVAYLVLLVLSVWAVLRRSDKWGFIGLCLLFPLLLFWTEFSTVWVQDPMVLYRSYLWAITIPGLIAVLLTGWSPKVLMTLGAGFAIGWAALAAERVLSMETELTVWSDAITKVDANAPANAVGRYRAYLNRGAYHLGRFSAEPAIQDFRAAQALGEPTGGAWLNMGVAQATLKQYGEALRSFQQAEDLGYTDAPLYFQRGELFLALDQFASAVENFSKALALRQSADVALQTRLRRADGYLRLGRYREAAADFEAVLAVNPGNSRHLTGLGMAYVGAQDGARALDAFNRALSSERSALGLYGRALAYATLGQNKPALQDLDEALKIEPQNGAFQSLRQAWAKGVRPPMAPQ